MEWANYIRRQGFLAHLLFSLSLEHYLPASTLEAKLHNNAEEVLGPLCLEGDYLYKLGAFGYRSVVAAQWGQCCHCAVHSRMCTQGELVIGSISVHPCVFGYRGIRLLPLLWEGRLTLLSLRWFGMDFWNSVTACHEHPTGFWHVEYVLWICWSAAPSLAPREQCWIAPALGSLLHRFGPELSVIIFLPALVGGSRPVLENTQPTPWPVWIQLPLWPRAFCLVPLQWDEGRAWLACLSVLSEGSHEMTTAAKCHLSGKEDHHKYLQCSSHILELLIHHSNNDQVPTVCQALFSGRRLEPWTGKLKLLFSRNIIRMGHKIISTSAGCSKGKKQVELRIQSSQVSRSGKASLRES